MERRETADRRQDHLYVANERRSGPHDRRNASTRQREREAERAKIEKIRAFKQKDQSASRGKPLFTTQRLLILGGILLVILIALLLMN